MNEVRVLCDIRKFSTDALVEELARRRNVLSDQRARAIKNWCDDCENFKFWTKSGEVPDNYNPCSKGHEMKFCMPQSYTDEYGFYRRVCADRKESTA